MIPSILTLRSLNTPHSRARFQCSSEDSCLTSSRSRKSPITRPEYSIACSRLFSKTDCSSVNFASIIAQCTDYNVFLTVFHVTRGHLSWRTDALKFQNTTVKMRAKSEITRLGVTLRVVSPGAEGASLSDALVFAALASKTKLYSLLP